ncbi:MAG: hypothetical protein MHM6MM_002718 [Cercozoa sp. M6MM]
MHDAFEPGRTEHFEHNVVELTQANIEDSLSTPEIDEIVNEGQLEELIDEAKKELQVDLALRERLMDRLEQLRDRTTRHKLLVMELLAEQEILRQTSDAQITQRQRKGYDGDKFVTVAVRSDTK